MSTSRSNLTLSVINCQLSGRILSRLSKGNLKKTCKQERCSRFFRAAVILHLVITSLYLQGPVLAYWWHTQLHQSAPALTRGKLLATLRSISWLTCINKDSIEIVWFLLQLPPMNLTPVRYFVHQKSAWEENKKLQGLKDKSSTL